MRWQERSTKYTVYHQLVQGRVVVGSASHNLTRSRADGPETAFRWRLDLPGKTREGLAETLDAAKAALAAALGDWLRAAELRDA
jgi:hypothetical protein